MPLKVNSCNDPLLMNSLNIQIVDCGYIPEGYGPCVPLCISELGVCHVGGQMTLISHFVVPWVDYGNYILHFTLVSIVHLHITVWGRRDVACEVTPPKGVWGNTPQGNFDNLRLLLVASGGPKQLLLS